MRILVTGAAGFIGSQLSLRLLAEGHEVVGIDSLNDYYSVDLKRDRLSTLTQSAAFSFYEGTVTEVLADTKLESLLVGQPLVHLAAQAGVRHGLRNPSSYVQSNLVDFWGALDLARRAELAHFVYASSSSVYGANRRLPFVETDEVNHPVSLYAATKRSNELMVESYAHLYGLPATGLRFFTVYGPWGRPDMAIFDFTRRILDGEPIPLFGGGRLSRDFTYVDDIVDGIVACLAKPPNSSSDSAVEVNSGTSPHLILNLGRGDETTVSDMVDALESALGVPALREFHSPQLGDVEHTLSSIGAANAWCGYQPKVPLSEGIERFVDWYRAYYNVPW